MHSIRHGSACSQAADKRPDEALPFLAKLYADGLANIIPETNAVSVSTDQINPRLLHDKNLRTCGMYPAIGFCASRHLPNYVFVTDTNESAIVIVAASPDLVVHSEKAHSLWTLCNSSGSVLATYLMTMNICEHDSISGMTFLNLAAFYTFFADYYIVLMGSAAGEASAGAPFACTCLRSISAHTWSQCRDASCSSRT